MSRPRFFSATWAEAVGQALEAGPDEQARAEKLQQYWDFYQFVRDGCTDSWALGVRDLPAELGGAPSYLWIRWGEGHVEECRIVGPDDPIEASYVLGGDYAHWKALLTGALDAQRTVMYRRIVLEEGDLLKFFTGVYFFAESLACIGRVPVAFPS